MTKKPAIYNLDDRENIWDMVNVLGYINDFAVGVGWESPDMDINAIRMILSGIHADFPHCDGIEAASPFKKAANFLCYFIAQSPILSPMPPSSLPEELVDVPNVQNIVVPFEFVIDMLHGARLLKNGDWVEIENPIELSSHSYTDIIGALKNTTPSTHFAIVAVLLEQLVYKTNPSLQYPT